ncbi:MAG: F0F1 ATP synthase subunit A, partial [Aggregatilineales bacterium]
RGVSGLQNAAGGYFLYNDEVFNVGTVATHHDYEVCHEFHDRHYKELPAIALDPFLDQAVTHVVEEGQTLEEIVAIYAAEAADISEGTPEYDGTDWYDRWADPHISVADVMERQGESLAYAEAVSAEGEAVTALEAGQTIVVRPEITGAHATTENQQLYMVVPFFRGAATDLNLTLGLSLLAFAVIQWFGISTLGLGYFQKFINVHALGNLGNNPLGAIDFVAGLFEIVSEFGKIISLSFRLFGAIFAGGVLYAVILFLAGTVTPVVILLLEIVVGTAQAGVFAILTLIFSAQAMISHIHHDDDDHGHH